MQKTNKLYFKILFTCLVVAVVLFFIFAVVIASSSGEKPADTEPQSKVPYIAEENRMGYGILIRFEDGAAEYFSFKGDVGETEVLLLSHGTSIVEVENRGYYVYATLDTDYDTLAVLFDRFGGLEMSTSEGVMKFTGVQITDMLSKTTDLGFRRSVIASLLAAMREKGFSGEDLLFLIENSRTNLSYPKGYNIPKVLESALDNVKFVN